MNNFSFFGVFIAGICFGSVFRHIGFLDSTSTILLSVLGLLFALYGGRQIIWGDK